MADTGEALHPNGVEHEAKENMKRLVIAWTSHTDGKVEKALPFVIAGWVARLVTDPDGSDVPTSYAVTWLDDQGVDMLQGLAAGRSTSVVEDQEIELANGIPVPVLTPSSTFKISGAGSVKKGVATLYWK